MQQMQQKNKCKHIKTYKKAQSTNPKKCKQKQNNTTTKHKFENLKNNEIHKQKQSKTKNKINSKN